MKEVCEDPEAKFPSVGIDSAYRLKAPVKFQ